MTPSQKCVLDFTRPLIFLAPMEGVVDAVLRDLLTQQGGIDACVTEFIRVTNHVHSSEIFYKYCPELLNDCRTPKGTPVFVQLLGSDANAMADNAAKAASLGAIGIDLNFGCPAKTVNNHDGGAALLKTPERLYKIITAVRGAVPAHIPVSAKMRLGFDTKVFAQDLANAVESANASWLCVHARTKVDGYKPPAYWEALAPLSQNLKLPLIANGEVWTQQQHQQCQKQSGTLHVMMGRGLVANPGLALEVAKQEPHKHWSHWDKFILSFLENSKKFRHENYAVQRAKQLTKMMGQTYGGALELHEDIKRIETFSLMKERIETHFETLHNGATPSASREAQLIVPRKRTTSNVVSATEIG